MSSEMYKLRIGIIVVLFFSFKSKGGKSAISVELRNPGVN